MAGQHRGAGLAAPARSGRVGVEDLAAKVHHRRVQHAAVQAGDAGVVHQQRRVATLRCRLRDRCRIGHIKLDLNDARCLALARRPDAGIHLSGAACECRLRKRQAQTAVRTGDEYHRILDVHAQAP
ncbi:hypothetical protein G6F61_014069 [Rhizopus arrhizus]|nr:hypothetical protein G6F61_014069 [Rhizopus arrhizus]